MHRPFTDPHPLRTEIPYSKVLHHIPVVGPVRLYLTGRGICSMPHQFCLFRLDAPRQSAAFELLFGLHEITIHHPSAPTFFTLRFCTHSCGGTGPPSTSLGFESVPMSNFPQLILFCTLLIRMQRSKRHSIATRTTPPSLARSDHFLSLRPIHSEKQPKPLCRWS